MEELPSFFFSLLEEETTKTSLRDCLVVAARIFLYHSPGLASTVLFPFSLSFCLWGFFILLCKMSATGGTIRSRTMGRGQLPFDPNSSSAIPRKVDHPVPPNVSSDIGGSSTLSTSRQKQSKRDEVYYFNPPFFLSLVERGRMRYVCTRGTVC